MLEKDGQGYTEDLENDKRHKETLYRRAWEI
jgi:hypothetical protein